MDSELVRAAIREPRVGQFIDDISIWWLRALESLTNTDYVQFSAEKDKLDPSHVAQAVMADFFVEKFGEWI